MLSSTRILTRAVLHYPQTWLTVLDALERGSQVGRESAPLYSLRFEELFELTPEQAREKAGIRGVRLADTSAASALWC
jgi:ubiquinone biosynthesis protein Coq4